MRSLVLSLLLCISAFAANPEPRTQVCNFDGENASNIYSLITMPGIGVTFRLPEGVKIVDFVVTDPTNFYGESNGIIGIVTPRVQGKSTSVNIYADNDRLYVFNLTSANNPSQVDQLVVVQSTDYQLFKNRIRSEAQAMAEEQSAVLAARYEADLEKETAKIRRQMLFSINNNYRILGDIFSIDSVSDDGVFTYVRLARSQERPVVYLGDAGKPKALEVVKYTDEGDYYVIHRVLGPEDKAFVFKLGDRLSEIRRK